MTDVKKEKKTKKSSRKDADSNDEPKQALGTDNDTLLVETESVSAKKKDKKEKKREKRARKSEDSKSKDLQPENTTSSPSPAKKKHKKEKKKKKEKKPANDSEKPASDDEAASDEDPPVLEGSMVEDQMVLIDRTKGIVYSGLDRRRNGDLKPIGKLENGKAVLDKCDEAVSEPTDGSPEFPFETDPDDHCESPLEAYNDIAPLLQLCGSNVSIYDPYYCDGTVAKNLETLGFPDVYNRKEDCYQAWASSKSYPSFNVLVTNPPYSGNHMEKLMSHISSKEFGDKPWFLLMPQFVHKKDYYVNSTAHNFPFFMVPRKRYVYLPPPSFRESKKSDTHKKSSPFVSMWYIWGGTPAKNEQLLAAAQNIHSCKVARTKNGLRDMRRSKQKKKK